MSNSLLVIEPYWTGGTWAFDDDRVGLRAEPFVCGVPELIDGMLGKLKPLAVKGFDLIFSPNPFPGHVLELIHESEESGGNWYTKAVTGERAWFCPALYKYFEKAPKKMFANFKLKDEPTKRS